jgi:hypothetical protein
MQGYVVRKGNQHYAVIYEGLDPHRPRAASLASRRARPRRSRTTRDEVRG